MTTTEQTDKIVGYYYRDGGLECTNCLDPSRTPESQLLDKDCEDGFTCCSCGDVFMPDSWEYDECQCGNLGWVNGEGKCSECETPV
jgi:hypothetical protein